MKVTTNLCALFADVSGSTRLYDQFGSTEAQKAINASLEVATEVVTQFNGRVIKTIGDEIFAVFPCANDGAQAACDIHRRMENMPVPPDKKVRMHIGLQTGEVVEVDNDVFGDAVNVAARLTKLAKPGQILTTAGTVDELDSGVMLATTQIRSAFIKGKAEKVDLVEIHWDNPFDATHVVGGLDTHHNSSQTLELSYNGDTVKIGQELPVIAIGRDTSSRIVVPSTRASRLHAWLEMRGNSFVLIDKSTNGTYVTFSGRPEFKVLNQELQLRNEGHISLGCPQEELPEYLIAFKISN